MSHFDHVWRHRKWPAADFNGPRQQDLRVGQRCRVLAVGRNGNVAVEFEDGTQVVGVRYCVTKAGPADAQLGQREGTRLGAGSVSAPTRLLRVEAPHFVAGAEFEKVGGGWVVGRAAPILGWMRRMPVEKIGPHLTHKGWGYRWS